MVAIEEYLRLRQPPDQPFVMHQEWRALAFLHFACDPEEVAPLLPPGLEVDTFDGKAWIGLVPFLMRGVRPRGLPGVPGHAHFAETNVRTYVHRDGREPGVWFFSLEASSSLACRVARTTFHLPYHEAEMDVRLLAGHCEYESTRCSGGQSCLVIGDAGPDLPAPQPGSLEFFLIERYQLYAQRGSRLMKGRVFHPPYTLRSFKVSTLEETLVAATGLTPRPFTHTVYSPGVDVRIYPITRAE